MGAGIGWLSGVVGIGGGIFLSPVLVFFRWAGAKQAAAAAACFIVANSAAGLSGRLLSGTMVYGPLWLPMTCAFAGGWVGSRLGARRFPAPAVQRILATVLVLACVKLLREI
jgi:uncharacterized membrane protein YfcA